MANLPKFLHKFGAGYGFGKYFNCDSVDVTARQIDWQVAAGEDGDGFTAYQAVKCDTCGRDHVIPASSFGDTCGSLVESDPDVYEIEEFGDEYDQAIRCSTRLESFEGPVMSAFWPCDFGDAREAAKKIDTFGVGPTCTVEFADGETGFALTGGGMDLSDEIAGAYVAVGHYPPAILRVQAHMFRNRSGRRSRAILHCLKESNRIIVSRARGRVADARRVSRELRVGDLYLKLRERLASLNPSASQTTIGDISRFVVRGRVDLLGDDLKALEIAAKIERLERAR